VKEKSPKDPPDCFYNEPNTHGAILPQTPCGA
jgi:hypothetical protein